MFYNVLELKDLVDNKENMFDRNVLLERGESSLSAIALKKTRSFGLTCISM